MTVSKRCMVLGGLAFGVFMLVFALTPADAHPVSACPSPGKIMWVAYGPRPGPVKVQKIRTYVLADDGPSAFARVKVAQPNITVDTLSVVATVDAVIVESAGDE